MLEPLGPPSPQRLSLPEVHGSVTTVAQPSIWRRMFAFAGPAYLISVGYMDPGNWATDIEGGARFGYRLLWVLVASNLIAILLQTLASRLGIVAGRDLAQACREAYPRPVNITLWVLGEVAILATDLAEVLGAAIGLHLLFGIPLLVGVLLTMADALLVLWLARFGIRAVEGVILTLVTVIAVCLVAELWLVRPVLGDVARGLVPHLDGASLYIAIGILGATVMPHNLYLHSALVQTRKLGDGVEHKRAACRFNLIDSAVALNGALIVNAAILILAGAVFYHRGIVVTQIDQAHALLAPLVGTVLAARLFAVALLCSGQSSTVTGTLAGQVIMEGFLRLRLRPVYRRLITRLAAITPAVLVIWLVGDDSVLQLLVLSQVILSLQLPFAVIPLLHFTADRRWMGELANPGWVRVAGWIVAAFLIGLNGMLFLKVAGAWVGSVTHFRWAAFLAAAVVVIGLGLLLAWMALRPWLPWTRLRAAAAER